MSLVLALCNRVAAANGAQIAERRLLDSMRMLEAGDMPGGRMASYRVNANTSAHDVVRGIGDNTPFAAVRDNYLHHPQTRSELIPLPDIGKLMVQPLARALQDFFGPRLQCGVEVAIDPFFNFCKVNWRSCHVFSNVNYNCIFSTSTQST